MSILSDFEHRLESIFEGVFTKTFRSGVHPLEIGRRLIREMEEKRTISINETLAPNMYQVILSPQDYERFSSFSGTVSAELSKLLIEQAHRRGYSLLTAPHIVFSQDRSLREGDFRVRGQVASESGEAPRPSAPAPIPIPEPATASPETPSPSSAKVAPEAAPEPAPEAPPARLLAIGGAGSGEVHALRKEQITLGRAAGNDIVIADPQVSRRHAIITRRQDGFVVADLRSTNGISINGHRVEEGLLDEGDILTLGSTNFRFTTRPET